MIKVVFTLLISSVLAACAPPEQRMSTTFNPDEYVPFAQPGTATVAGQAFLRQQGGGVVTCAGSDVLLFPNTAYIREAIAIMKSGATPTGMPTMSDPRMKGAGRRQQCNAQGNFKFENVPEGNWFVASEVKWAVGYARQGGSLVQEIHTSPGVTTDVLLTDRDLIGW
jgi:hypothetical protein